MTTHEFSVRAAVALAFCAGTLATTSVSRGQATFSNVNPIVINDSNANDGDNEPASPYPSVIAVSGLQGEIAKITVRVNALTHNRVQDVNLLLRSPEGTSVYLLGDAMTASASTNAWLTFDDRAALAVSEVDPLVTGRYRPSNFGDIEIFPAPAPAGPFESSLSSLIGEDPNGNWRLFVIDDSGPNPSATNEIVGSWAVEITTGFTFSSTDGPIAIPEGPGTSGAADVYPSRITVSGLPATMEDCFITLHGLSHTFVADMDIVARSPNGRTVTLIDNLAAVAPVNDATMVFEDSSLLNPAAASGYYLPNDPDPSDSLGAPGPAGPHGFHLGRFSGVDPNGEWRLFIEDEFTIDIGTLEGWSITFLYPTSSFSSGGGSNCPGDADGDGDVDFNDLNLVLDNFAEICLP